MGFHVSFVGGSRISIIVLPKSRTWVCAFPYQNPHQALQVPKLQASIPSNPCPEAPPPLSRVMRMLACVITLSVRDIATVNCPCTCKESPKPQYSILIPQIYSTPASNLEDLHLDFVCERLMKARSLRDDWHSADISQT